MKLKVTLALVFVLMMTVWAGPALGVGQGTCDTGYDEKYEGSGPFNLTAPDGMVFTQVIIKAGSDQSAGEACNYFTSDSSGCYSVSGIGTDTLSVSKIGSGPECKDISHIEVFYGIEEQEIDDEEKPPEDTSTSTQEITQTTEVTQTGDDPAASQTSTSNPAVTSTTSGGTASNLPSTGLIMIMPLAGLGLAAAGILMRKRSK